MYEMWKGFSLSKLLFHNIYARNVADGVVQFDTDTDQIGIQDLQVRCQDHHLKDDRFSKVKNDEAGQCMAIKFAFVSHFLLLT